MRNYILLFAISVVAVLLVAGCSGSDSTPNSFAGSYAGSASSTAPAAIPVALKPNASISTTIAMVIGTDGKITIRSAASDGAVTSITGSIDENGSGTCTVVSSAGVSSNQSIVVTKGGSGMEPGMVSITMKDATNTTTMVAFLSTASTYAGSWSGTYTVNSGSTKYNISMNIDAANGFTGVAQSASGGSGSNPFVGLYTTSGTYVTSRDSSGSVAKMTGTMTFSSATAMTGTLTQTDGTVSHVTMTKS
ncbi:MAG TPA: hypothetical protein VGK19_24305 [Capsulimonadaceae bacterium]|jgi:hypothetical protein